MLHGEIREEIKLEGEEEGKKKKWTQLKMPREVLGRELSGGQDGGRDIALVTEATADCLRF